MTAAVLLAMGSSLLLTLILELLFACIYGVRGKHDLVICVLANTLTNPVVTCTYYYMQYSVGMSGEMLILATVILEISAVTAEWLVYRNNTEIKRPLLFSMAANAFSYSAGVIMTYLV
ncbi:MAG: hypothetical protein ACI4KF_13045 [Huintestinicola sp.]